MKTIKKALIPVAVVAVVALLSIQSSYQMFFPMMYRNIVKHPEMGTELERNFSSINVVFPGGILRMSTHWNSENWQAGFDEILNKTAGFTGRLLLTIKGYDCHQPANYLWQDYVNFSLSAIGQLQQRGVQVVALEVWNEPDADFGATGSKGDFFGCWGNNVTAGSGYAAFVNFIYPQIKSQYPNIRILAGAISSVNGKFLTGMLANLIVTDAVSFHCHISNYDWVGCDWSITQMDTQTEYPLWLTETAVMCNDSCDPEDLYCKVIPCKNHDIKQQQHFALLSQDERIDVAIWYCLCCNGWMNTDMLPPVYGDFVNWLGE